MTLLEKNDIVGGRMQSYSPPEAPEYRFDTGPSLLLFPQKYRDVRTSPRPHLLKLNTRWTGKKNDDNIDNRSLTRFAHAAVSREAGELCLVPRVGSLQRSLDDATNTDTTCTVPISDTKSY